MREFLPLIKPFHMEIHVFDGVEDSSYSARAGRALDIFRKTYGIEERLTFNIDSKFPGNVTRNARLSER